MRGFQSTAYSRLGSTNNNHCLCQSIKSLISCIMFPRRRLVTKLASLSLLAVFCVWLYGSSTMTSEGGALVFAKNDVLQVGSEVRKGGAEQLVTEPKRTHHHSNQTLNKMMRNMTLLKANQSALQNIIQRVNESVVLNDKLQEHHQANPHPFSYVINTKNMCKNKNIFLIVYVHTAPDHYKRRMVIRQTWGNPKYYTNIIRVVFVMGKSLGQDQVQNALQFESDQYGDIVQEDFIDSYKNLTYKGVAGLKWVSTYCRNAKFTLKSDDDIFVNMFTLLRHLNSLDALNVQNKGLIMCLVWYRMKVMRTGKWKVNVTDFKDDYYPTYCSGSAYTMSTDVVVSMHEVSYQVPFFWVDDFYITGLLPLKLGLKHKQFMSTYVLDGRKLEDKFTGPQWFTYIFSHVHDLNKIQSVWNRLIELNKGSVAPKVKYALPGQLPKETEKKKDGKKG